MLDTSPKEVPVLVYLDQSDLASISDGKARGTDLLRDAIAQTSAQLLVSTAHLLDLARADAVTKARWRVAVCSFGVVRFAVEPGIGEEVDATRLAELMTEADGPVQIFAESLSIKQEAAMTGRETRLAAPPHLSPTQLRNIAESILDGTIPDGMDLSRDAIAAFEPVLSQLREVASSLGLDREAILSALTPGTEPAMSRGDLAEVVRLQRDLDKQRKPQISDTADELHLRFAVHADVVTVDANVAHAMRPTFGRAVPVDGRDRTQVVVLRSGDLESVAHAVCAIHAGM